MTEKERKHAADKLMGTKILMKGKILPKIFMADGHCYLFLNAARRAVFGTNLPIEVMTVREAFEIATGQNSNELPRESVEWNFDQTGSTYNGLLFAPRYGNSTMASMVQNDIVTCGYVSKDIIAALELPINASCLSVRTTNIIIRHMGMQTYGDLVRYGRKELLKVRNVGQAVLHEIDSLMAVKGLEEQWNK